MRCAFRVSHFAPIYHHFRDILANIGALLALLSNDIYNALYP